MKIYGYDGQGRSCFAYPRPAFTSRLLLCFLRLDFDLACYRHIEFDSFDVTALDLELP